MKPRTLTAILMACIAVSALLSCKGKKKTEEEQLAGMRSSLKYKTYKASSQYGLKAMQIAGQDSCQDCERVFHSMLAVHWSLIANKPTLAIAETDILDEKYGDAPKDEFSGIPKLTRSIAMYESGWPGLAKKESEDGLKLYGLDSNALQQLGRDKEALVRLVYMAVLLKLNRPEESRVHALALSRLFDAPYIVPMMDAAGDAKAGRIQEAVQQVKALSKDTSVPLSVRSEMSKLVVDMEKKGGDAHSPFFMPRLVAALLWEEIRKGNDKTIQKLKAPLDKMIQ